LTGLSLCRSDVKRGVTYLSPVVMPLVMRAQDKHRECSNDAGERSPSINHLFFSIQP